MERFIVNRLPKIWPAAASAVLALASFEPLNLSLVVFVAFVPLLLYLRSCDGKRAFRAGMLFGFIFWLGQFSFVAQFVGAWTQSWILGFVPYVLGCFIASLYFAAFGWLAHLCFKRGLGWAVPMAWVGIEVLRSYIVGLAFPFGLLGTTLTAFPPIIQSAHFGSIYLVSGWILLGNMIVAELMKGPYTAVRWHLAVFGFVLAGSLVRYAIPPGGQTRTVVAGQTGVNMAFGDQTQTPARVAAAVDAIVRSAGGADLLVLPEGIVRAGDSMPPPIMFSLRPDLPTVFGGQRGEGPTYQSAFGFDGDWTFADKTRLVIFGEYVPFRDQLPFLESFELPTGDLTPAERVVTLEVGGFRVGTAICFESLFADIPYRHARNGANILAVMSVDDWYMGTVAPIQLRDASVWRAIETGIPVVRAASLGYSVIVDARGRIVAQAPLHETVALSASVVVPEQADLFPLMPVFPLVSLLSLFVIPALEAAYRIRKRKAL